MLEFSNACIGEVRHVRGESLLVFNARNSHMRRF